MDTHQRNLSAIDLVKLERLAETAIKVGLRLEPGQDLFMTAPVAALPWRGGLRLRLTRRERVW